MKPSYFGRAFAGIAAAVLAGCGGSQLPMGAPASGGSPNVYARHHTFRYTGKKQKFRVPAGVTQIKIFSSGGLGGGAVVTHAGRVTAVVPVEPFETLYVYVGGNGTSKDGGFNGGAPGGSYGSGDSGGYGGGGASDVREGGDKLADRILVAGGGGGQGGGDDWRSNQYGTGGKGGGLIGGEGEVGLGDYYSSSEGCDSSGDAIDDRDRGDAGCGGAGGTQKAGGNGGLGGYGDYCYGGQGTDGSLGVGGAGASAGSYDCSSLGGGGGGGYYGGGGGGEGGWLYSSYFGGGGGGGGGSSYVEPSGTGVHMWQGWKQSQYGLVVFDW